MNVSTLKTRVTDRLRSVRARRPGVDHALRAYDRNSDVLGGQLAAAVTYFGFLSFFPLLALVFSVLGYVAGGHPGVQDGVTRAIEQAFPSLVGTGPGQVNIDTIIQARAGAGVIGLVGLAYAGLGWLDSLRDALRRVFGTENAKLSLLRKKLTDVLVLVLLGATLLASVVVSSLATAVTTWALGTVGLADSAVAGVALRVLSVGLAMVLDVVLFVILLSRLSGARLSWSQVRSGALLGAVGFAVLKLVGTFLVARTTQNPVYATFGVVVGLLVWINLVSRLLVFSAAWTATQPYSLDPAPLGEPGAGRATALASGTEPVLPVAPGDYEPVPVDADSSSNGRDGRGR